MIGKVTRLMEIAVEHYGSHKKIPKPLQRVIKNAEHYRLNTVVLRHILEGEGSSDVRFFAYVRRKFSQNPLDYIFEKAPRLTSRLTSTGKWPEHFRHIEPKYKESLLREITDVYGSLEDLRKLSRDLKLLVVDMAVIGHPRMLAYNLLVDAFERQDFEWKVFNLCERVIKKNPKADTFRELLRVNPWNTPFRLP